VKRPGKQFRKAKSLASGPTAPAPSSSQAGDIAPPQGAEPISVSDLSLHELFEQQTRNMLERADIDEEQKQSILVAMACPCCGAGGMSFSVKLKGRRLDGA